MATRCGIEGFPASPGIRIGHQRAVPLVMKTMLVVVLILLPFFPINCEEFCLSDKIRGACPCPSAVPELSHSLLLTGIPGAAQDTCFMIVKEAGESFSQLGNHTWQAGQDLCSSYGGSLPTIDTKDNQTAVMHVVHRFEIDLADQYFAINTNDTETQFDLVVWTTKNNVDDDGSKCIKFFDNEFQRVDCGEELNVICEFVNKI